ncbi:uncharacterized protein LOC126898135 [Daktulosphaira vitifoliae]|uniref:uncharacterized protein LOC126898135 n=1 Tax=Daktulosphaira vitifoliae TaxID=58002 RepID=UPI0021AA16E2|nr:uncharacterized protein LOC126898135 [Daktulosphaira vitifoliae]
MSIDNPNYSFNFDTYEQGQNCSMPNIILNQFFDIPGDGNCLFYSLIKVMNLSISSLELRKLLLQSEYLHTCQSPSSAQTILSSASEYGDLDCIFIFSKEYNQNICVHFHFFNSVSKKSDVIFCHFKSNYSSNFIHLHLQNNHFTPYIEVGQFISNDRVNDHEMVDLSIETDLNSVNNDDDNVDCENNDDGNNNDEENMPIDEATVTLPIYTRYYEHANGHLQFHRKFKNNSFGHSCAVCNRLWWKGDLKNTTDAHADILQNILPNFNIGSTFKICSTCRSALDKGKIPLLSTYNGFSYPKIPLHLPKLNIIEQRLISPRIPFMQIRRLRHMNGQYGIYGQIINVPVKVDTMVKQLPRNLEDDHCFYVHLKKKLIHKSSYVHGLVSKKNIKEWLSYLVKTPLYIHENITISEAFLNNYSDTEINNDISIEEYSEHVPIEDNLTAQQQTMLWNEDEMLLMAPGEKSAPKSLLFDQYAEELSYPTIYGGQFRNYKEGCNVTSFMQATSELRRADRRATDPQHLLYVAAKIMRQRVSSSVNVAFKHVGSNTKITKADIQSEEYINCCIESNLAFLRCIPNSAWYWTERKKELFAMIRQLGAPTAFMTLSANETGWTDLLKILYKLKNNGVDICDEFLSKMSYVQKAELVNEDAITCAIYFNKLVNCLMSILQSKRGNPFGKYRVCHFFKRIEFQHRGSPHAHILLWFDNAPEDLLNNTRDFIEMVDSLISVSESEASGNIKLQTHKHTFTCYKNMNPLLPRKNQGLNEENPLFIELNIQNHRYYVQDEVLCPFAFDF